MSVSRRDFAILFICVLHGRVTHAANRPQPVRRIGRLFLGDPDLSPNPADADDLNRFGWVEGKNLLVERRFANGRPESLKMLALALVRMNVELIVTQGSQETLAALAATKSVPVVFSVGDPVAMGIVKSLARPGNNATGFSLAGPETEAKQLTIAMELLPGLRRIGIFEPEDHPYFMLTANRFDSLCRGFGLDPLRVRVGDRAEIDAAMTHLSKQNAQAVILRGSSFVQDHGTEIVNAALRTSLPPLAEQPELVRDAGALISYSGVSEQANERVAYYVDRILRGAKPADLPIEQPTRFALLINLKAAKTLGLSVPSALLQRADDVIR